MSARFSRRSLLGTTLAAGATLALHGRARAATPIRIGVLTDMSGPYAADSGQGSIVAAQLAIEDFAKLHPEIPVQLISADMQDKPDVAASIAGKWFDRDGVDMVVDVPVSSAALAVAGVARQKNKVAILNPGTSELTGKACGPNHIHWAFDTYSLAASTGKAVLAEGGKSWYFIQADYAFGASLVADASGIIQAGGGKVMGAVKYPFPGTTDFSSYLLQAQSSGAKVIALANAGADAANSIKQANEFGITQGGARLAALLCFISQIHGIGLQAAQKLLLTEAFYWNLNDATRALSARFAAKMNGAKPGTIQAGTYSGVLHYLKAVAAMGVDAAKANGAAAVQEMKKLPTDDAAFGKGRVREDGRKIHDMHLFQVKTPAESKEPWDIYKLVRTTPGEEAFRPLNAGGCPMIHA